MQSIYVIIPVYNEGKVIRQTLEDILRYGYNIVIVDDGSDENIIGLIQGMPVYYIRHRLNLGQGAAIQTGIVFALKKGAEIIVTFDADGQHDAADIGPMIQLLADKKVDIIFGSRFMTVAPSKITFLRKFILHSARFLNYLFSGILLSDAHNGLRVFNRKAGASFKILENRMAHATEILINVKRNRLRFAEYPVYIRYTTYSKKKGQTIMHGFKILQDIVLYKIFK
jgi:polyprenyl-phospho-N-acetylgalactosaminyl synthase